MVAGLPRRGIGRLWDIGYGSATANVMTALQASSEPTKALPSPLPTAPLLLVSLTSKRKVSPGYTARRNFTSSARPKSTIFPRDSGWESTATAPVCANASSCSTPGNTGCPGK